MTIDTAMVLAAGLGTRFRAVSGDLPKPLVTVAGKSLIDWTLGTLLEGGVERVVVNVHYKADLVETHLRHRELPELAISDERQELMETGGGLMKATSLLGGGPVFCSNTDAIFDPSCSSPVPALRQAWRDSDMDALLLLVPLGNVTGYDGKGDFCLGPDGRISRDGSGERLVFTGLQIIHPRLWADEPLRPCSTNVFWEKALSAGRVFGHVYDGRWMHVGDPEGYDAATAILNGADQ